MMMKKAILLAAAFVVGAAVILPLAGHGIAYEGEATMAFDKALWTDTAAIYDLPHIRLSMIDDVLKHHIAAGMTRSEVLKALGDPTETPYFKDYDLVYWLGEEKGFVSVDSSWLVVKFGTDGGVSDFRVVTD